MMESTSQNKKSNVPVVVTTNWSIISKILLTLVIGGIAGLLVRDMGMFALLIFPCIAVVLAAVLQPDLGVMIFLFVTYLQLSNVLIVFHGLPSIAQPLAVLLIVIIAMRIIFHREWPYNWSKTAMVLGLYVLAIFVSMYAAGNRDAALRAFVGFFKDILGGVLVFFLIRKPSSFRAAIWTLIVAGLLTGSISVFQHLTGTFSNPYWGFGGWAAQVSGDVTRERSTGPYSNPNAYAQVLITIIPLALERLWHERKTILRLVATLSLIMCVLTVTFTYSRGGFLSMLVAVGFFFAMFRPRILPLFLTVGIVFAVLQFLPAGYLNRISTVVQLTSSNQSLVADPSFRGRMSENSAAIGMFLDNPLLGVGVGNYPVNYQDYAREIGLEARREARTPASLYLEILSEQGVIGIVTFLLFLLYLFVNGFRAIRRFTANGLIEESFLMKALIAGVLGYLVAAYVKNSAYANVFWALLGVTLGAIHLSYAQISKKWILRGPG